MRLLLVVILAFSMTGCVDLLVRALLSPSTFGKELLAGMAANTASSLVGPGDAATMGEVFSSIESLKQYVADNPGAPNEADIMELIGDLEQQAKHQATEIPDARDLVQNPRSLNRIDGRHRGGSGTFAAGEFIDPRYRVGAKTWVVEHPGDHSRRLRARDQHRPVHASSSSIDLGIEISALAALRDAAYGSDRTLLSDLDIVDPSKIRGRGETGAPANEADMEALGFRGDGESRTFDATVGAGSDE